MDTTTIFASDVLNQATVGQPPVTDSDIEATCPNCGTIRLSDCLVTGAAETTYTHAACDSVILVIGPPNSDGAPWPGRGFRLGDFVLRNATDLRYRGIRIPASPHALATSRE